MIQLKLKMCMNLVYNFLKCFYWTLAVWNLLYVRNIRVNQQATYSVIKAIKIFIPLK